METGRTFETERLLLAAMAQPVAVSRLSSVRGMLGAKKVGAEDNLARSLD